MRPLRRLARQGNLVAVPRASQRRSLDAPLHEPQPGGTSVDASEAELDALRADLVSELDRRAAREAPGSATFRRVA